MVRRRLHLFVSPKYELISGVDVNHLLDNRSAHARLVLLSKRATLVAFDAFQVLLEPLVEALVVLLFHRLTLGVDAIHSEMRQCSSTEYSALCSVFSPNSGSLLTSDGVSASPVRPTPEDPETKKKNESSINGNYQISRFFYNRIEP